MASLKYVANSSLQTVTLGSGYTSGSGTMTLTSGHGARLPTGGDFWLAYNDGAGTVRLFKVTARSTDTLTVVADATEGSGDGNITSGETLRWALTVAALTQLRSDIAAEVGGLVLLETQTASSSSQLDFTASISSTYDNYMLIGELLVPSTNSAGFRMRYSDDGGSNYISTSNYTWGAFRFNSGGSASHGGTSQAQLGLNNTQSNSVSSFNFAITIYNPLAAAHTIFSGQAAGNDGSVDGYMLHGILQTTASVNAIRVFPSAGNITSGVIRCYGIKK
jgi:hypothetical protein